ncbi:hypothetical protein GCM10010112_67790 [Actinoplanes lobatus]|uniref:Uncharacterized protein n=1 Tax=Actinoplanes lobatus TaxID=113568 RepID=A0A7W7HEL5_9ACTN|nr:hypothetical protein [Actinoplanes lobatus]MBB4749141.1 hypothetical protein [Actinoplanes lobatus]GGN86345.1 hypothetical protein GCM10010112_67790 [Actinoplanes lobatus]GIE42761.1 hypothetical protein Alo02nite_56590 [Actinoplanes lobatus]
MTVEDDDAAARLEAMRQRQDGDYEPPILAEPRGGPIPVWAPESDAEG